MQFDWPKRRKFITLLGGAATWPRSVRVQPPDRMRRIGSLSGSPKDRYYPPPVWAFIWGILANIS
jgi:hypothetical protein